jgi:hypothetical protein
MYYDANAANGDVTTGTQLGPVSNASWTSGLAAAYSVVEAVDLTFFIAQDRKRGRVVIMTNGLEMQVISTPFIGKILDLSSLGDNVRCWSLRSVGHTFYGLTLTDLNCTLVYDVASNQWQLWSSLVNGTEQYFIGANYLNGQGMDLFQSLSTGAVFQMQPNLYQDSGVSIPVTSVTAIYDFGTINYKRIASLFCLGDNINSSITVDFSDDDYQTWTGAKVISLQQTRKQIQRAGRFRRRAYRMQHSDNTPLRLVDGKLDAAILSS